MHQALSDYTLARRQNRQYFRRGGGNCGGDLMRHLGDEVLQVARRYRTHFCQFDTVLTGKLAWVGLPRDGEREMGTQAGEY